MVFLDMIVKAQATLQQHYINAPEKISLPGIQRLLSTTKLFACQPALLEVTVAQYFQRVLSMDQPLEEVFCTSLGGPQ